MPKIFIDNQPYEVKAGKNLLESCLSLGFDLPYFCWHPAMGSVGACRQCAVKLFKDEDDQHGRLVMSCMENINEGLRISINDTTARAFREQVIEWLMTNHPHDCPVCDEGGNCQLQDMTVMTGHDYRRFNFKKRTYRNQYLGPLVHHEMNRCIQCYRCVRYYRDYAGGEDLNVFGAHNHVYFGREQDGILQSPFSGNLAEVCPTGVFTDKTLKQHYTRKWDLTSAPSVCQHCSVGCNIFAAERYGKLRCITNRFNGEVNGYFLCDRGRFGYEFVNSENRITTPIIRDQAVEAVDEQTLMKNLKSSLNSRKLIGIGSPRASMETNFSLLQLVGRDNFYQGIGEKQAQLEKVAFDCLASGTVHSCTLKEIEMADAVLVLGEDVWNTAPMMALSIRQAVMKTAAAQAMQQTPMSAWNDSAIRELVQEKKGFLATVTISGSPLDEIATCVRYAAPDDIARLGFAVANLLNPGLAPVAHLDEQTRADAKMIADALQHARHPVIISGVSCCSESVIKAAFNIAAALNTGERRSGIAFVVPECNSMGMAMMQAASLDKAIERVEHEEGATVIIVEHDIYRSIPAAKADAFFRRCKQAIVLDSLHTLTTGKAQVLIPSATFAEGDGTLVNNEGRAQRFYQVYVPSNQYIRESWRWLSKMRSLQFTGNNGLEHHPDELLLSLEEAMPQFGGISKVAPPPDFRIKGQLIPREPHRYSGRTAILANINVSEPKPLSDGDSPLSFTMEGYQGIPPSSATPFYWAPGWNSGQSVNKYQQEVGGPLRGGDPGVRLFNDKPGSTKFFEAIPEKFKVANKNWLLLPQHHLFGSGELSAYSKAIAQLSPEPAIFLSKWDAEQLKVENGSVATINTEESKIALPVIVRENLGKGMVMISKGFPGMEGYDWGTWVTISS